jgi:transcriptional regulator with XRE-family HTH domain
MTGKSNRLGEYLRYLRTRKGLTLRELSIQVGYTDAYINRLELGKRSTGLRRLWELVNTLDGDYIYALAALCADEGVPEEIVEQISSRSPPDRV